MKNSVVPSKNCQNSVFHDKFFPNSAVPQALMIPIWMMVGYRTFSVFKIELEIFSYCVKLAFALVHRIKGKRSLIPVAPINALWTVNVGAGDVDDWVLKMIGLCCCWLLQLGTYNSSSCGSPKRPPIGLITVYIGSSVPARISLEQMLSNLQVNLCLP